MTPGAGGETVPAVHAGRHVHDAQARRHGPGADHLPPAGRADGRAHLARQRAGRGQPRSTSPSGSASARTQARGRIVPAEAARGCGVLIVDDNAAAREILDDPLSDVARRADAVASGPEAIAAIKQADADRALRHRLHGLAHARHGRPAGQPAHQERRDAQASARDRPGHGVRPRRGARGSRAAPSRRLPGQAGDQVDARRHARERLRRRPGADRAARAATARTGSTRLRGARILLVEDNEINQQIAVELLEGVGATVDVANNGREAVDKLLTGRSRRPSTSC